MPWTIAPLPQDLSLCPVAAPRAFLNRTSRWTSGRLFQREQGGTLTTKSIRQQILCFIKQADPDSVPKAHDVRAVSTSIDYFHFMDFQALSAYTGWKSAGVFIRHYLKNLHSLRFHTVAAGKVRSCLQRVLVRVLLTLILNYCYQGDRRKGLFLPSLGTAYYRAMTL